jgi:curved DNA-binding protein
MTDYYQTLGIPRTASEDEIKRAYRKAAMKHHPDRGGDQTKFQALQEAYATLSDPQKRQQYDNPQPHVRVNVNGRPFHGGGSPFDFDSIFDIFGTRFQHPQQARGRTQARMSLWITMADVARGGHRTVSIGTQQGAQAVEIEIPTGINDGDTVQYPGLAPGGGDLVVQFRIHPDPNWQRNGLDLVTEIPVSIWDMILGADITVRSLMGTELVTAVPAGIEPGQMLRLRRQGLRDRHSNQGDILVKIRPHIPKNISPEIIQAIQNHR